MDSPSSARRHKSFQFFLPVEDDDDTWCRGVAAGVVLHHQKSLAVRRNVVRALERRREVSSIKELLRVACDEVNRDSLDSAVSQTQTSFS